MAVCSFIGHRDVYDADMEFRLQTVVDQITNEHETAEFLIYLRGEFHSLCLLAVLRAKTRWPLKVTITLLDLDDVQYAKVPTCMIDKIITPHFKDAKGNSAGISHNRLLKWLAQKSTHLIIYNYDKLYDTERHSLKIPAALETIRLSSPETETAIEEAVPFMTEKEQIVFQRMNEGCTLKEAGKALGVGRERARQYLQSGCRTLHKQLLRRYFKTLAAEHRLGKRSCGLFALGEATYKSLSYFKCVFNFLTSRYVAKDIYVEHTCVRSSFVFVLTISYHDLHITTMTSGKSMEENSSDLDSIEKMLRPPCHAVRCVSYTDFESGSGDFDVIADMLDQMDFCICDLSAAPHAEKIRKYAAQGKRTALLDLSKTDVVVEGG